MTNRDKRPGAARSEPATGDDNIAAIGCAAVREAMSARLDGEVAPLDETVVADHLGRCSECRSFAQRAGELNPLLRVRPAEQIPDLTDRILADAPRHLDGEG